VVVLLPVTDPEKREIAARHLFHVKICMNCGAKNPPRAEKCRRCKSRRLRWKKRAKGKK